MTDLSPLARHFPRFLGAEGLVERTVAWLVERCQAGETCLDLNAWAGRPLGEDGPLCPDINAWREQLLAHPHIGPGKPLVLDGHRLYLARHHEAEKTIAEGILARLEFDSLAETDKIRPTLKKLFPESGEQKTAVAVACARRFAVITGGPGTGKTTTVLRLIALWQHLRPGLRLGLAAPTGKAAGRLAESLAAGRAGLPPGFGAGIPERAATLHRLLGIGRADPHGPDHPLPLDALIVDEASMVDQELMARLMAALPPQSRLILLGDRHQLASVEAGSVLGDITGRGRRLAYSQEMAAWLERLEADPGDDPELFGGIHDAIVELRRSHRFSSDQGIGRLAQAVREGKTAAAKACLKEEKEVDFWPQADEAPDRHVLKWMDRHYRPVLEASTVGEALAALAKSRVLTAVHAGPWGEEGLTTRFETGLSRWGKIADPARPYHGLPILITRNDYETGLFNGDIGILWQEEGHLRACFPSGDEIRRIPLRQLPHWQKAWAMTVHRAQGSEFDAVLLLLPPPETPVLTRELIYTGITRARKRCILAGPKNALETGLKRQVERASGLAERLGWE
ncbi:exodeoxyribonuclease V subunit alpha [Methylomarinovum tepidoasis]|nr:exodeoxyribonuclease V subunit alpha [Methylomarinovum sp. IN45]